MEAKEQSGLRPCRCENNTDNKLANMSVQCDVCTKPINAVNDRVFCFGGCGQVLHAKCAELTSAGATALRENVCMKYMCHDCRKKQICLNTMMGKCDEILEAIKCIEGRIEKIEYNCEKNSACEMIKNSENILKTFIQKCIEEQMIKVKSYVDQCLSAEKQNLKNNAPGVDEGLARMNGNPSTSYARIVSGKQVIVNDSVLRSGRIRNKSVSTSKSVGNGQTYDNVQNGDSENNREIEQKRKGLKPTLECTVRIKPVTEKINQQTKREVRNKINPSQMGIKNVRNGMNGSIVVECGTKVEAEGLLHKVREELGRSYEAIIEKPKRPKIKILNVGDEYESDDLKEILKSQNDIKNIQHFQIVKTIKHRRGVFTEFTIICEIDSVTFEQVMTKGKVFIDLDRCRVTECVDVLRCFKCCGYGHKSTKCINDPHCAKCAGDHDVKMCSSEQVKCVNCIVSNKERKTILDVNHTSWSFECPIYLKKRKISKQYIGYDK